MRTHPRNRGWVLVVEGGMHLRPSSRSARHSVPGRAFPALALAAVLATAACGDDDRTSADSGTTDLVATTVPVTSTVSATSAATSSTSPTETTAATATPSTTESDPRGPSGSRGAADRPVALGGDALHDMRLSQSPAELIELFGLTGLPYVADDANLLAATHEVDLDRGEVHNAMIYQVSYDGDADDLLEAFQEHFPNGTRMDEWISDIVTEGEERVLRVSPPMDGSEPRDMFRLQVRARPVATDPTEHHLVVDEMLRPDAPHMARVLEAELDEPMGVIDGLGLDGVGWEYFAFVEVRSPGFHEGTEFVYRFEVPPTQTEQIAVDLEAATSATPGTPADPDVVVDLMDDDEVRWIVYADGSGEVVVRHEQQR